MKKLTIGLIGNPNSGKTTLFNQLTGSRQRVGNWAGVTVERKEGQFSTTDHQVTLVDLPGTYSLTTISSQTSLDEQIACHYILSGDADLLINVVDASNLERNLYLTLQLLELGIPCIVALNMLDIAEKQNIRIEIDALSARLGCPVIPLVSTRGRGIEALKLAIDRYTFAHILSIADRNHSHYHCVVDYLISPLLANHLVSCRCQTPHEVVIQLMRNK